MLKGALALIVAGTLFLLVLSWGGPQSHKCGEITHLPALPTPGRFVKGSEHPNATWPFVTGNTYRIISDLAFDDRQWSAYQTTVCDFLRKAMSLKAPRGRDVVVYVPTPSVRRFLAEVHPHIPFRYRLAVSDSDFGFPSLRFPPGAMYAPRVSFEPAAGSLLDDPKVIAVFASNVDASHAKLTHIPLGFTTNPDKVKEEMIAIQAQLRAAPRERDILVYINFDVTSNERRRTAREILSVVLRGEAKIEEGLDRGQYYKRLAQSMFVYSPPGNGLDCHRTWQSLTLGAYLLVESGPLDPLYERFPVLILDSVKQATPELLRAEYARLQKQFGDEKYKERLYAPYWQSVIYGTE